MKSKDNNTKLFCMPEEQKKELYEFVYSISVELEKKLDDFERGKLYQKIKSFSRRINSDSNYKIIEEESSIEISSNSK